MRKLCGLFYLDSQNVEVIFISISTDQKIINMFEKKIVFSDCAVLQLETHETFLKWPWNVL